MDKNLNINELISEKNSKKKKFVLKDEHLKNLNNSMSSTLTASSRKIPNKKNSLRTITKAEHNETNINNNTIKKTYYQKKAKIAGKTYLIYKSDKKKKSISSINSDKNDNNIYNKSKISSSKITPDSSTPIKTSLFTQRNSNKKSATNIIQSSRKASKYLNENNKNKSTINVSSRIKNNPNHNNKIKTKRNSLNKKIRSISIDKNSIMKKQGENKQEIISKKNMDTIKDIILNYVGEDNTTVTISKTGIKFLAKIFYEKKKIEFKLFLIQAEKNKISITGELIKGDNSYFEKIFFALKDKLK